MIRRLINANATGGFDYVAVHEAAHVVAAETHGLRADGMVVNVLPVDGVRGEAVIDCQPSMTAAVITCDCAGLVAEKIYARHGERDVPLDGALDDCAFASAVELLQHRDPRHDGMQAAGTWAAAVGGFCGSEFGEFLYGACKTAARTLVAGWPAVRRLACLALRSSPGQVNGHEIRTTMRACGLKTTPLYRASVCNSNLLGPQRRIVAAGLRASVATGTINGAPWTRC